MGRATFSRPARRILLVVWTAVVLALLALPVYAVARSGSASVDALWTTLRIAALEAFTLILFSIVTGSFRSFFNRMFGARPVHRLHVAAGAVGLAVAVAHGICAALFGVSSYRVGAVWVGPTVLALLVVVIATALMRTRLRRSWRWIHRVNYVIFAAICVHGVILGSDLWSGTVLKVVLIVYAGVALVGLGRRSVTWSRG